MRTSKRAKRIVVVLLALVLVVAAAVPALAASQQVEDVLALLARLQRVDINPEWLPDIEKNEQTVQQLLDLYMECTPEEKAEFTKQQNDDLRAYFEALYTVQGKDVAGVDALFGAAGGSSSSPPASSSESEAPASSSSSSPPQSSSAPADSSQSVPDDSAASSSLSAASGSGEDSSAAESAQAGSSSAESSSAPVGAGGVQSSTTEGQSPPSGASGRGVGTIVLVVLGLVVVVLFVRFVASLKKAPAPQQNTEEENLRAQELFGENYDAEAMKKQLTAEIPDEELPAESVGETIAPFTPSPITFAEAKKGKKPSARQTAKQSRPQAGPKEKAAPAAAPKDAVVTTGNVAPPKQESHTLPLLRQQEEPTGAEKASAPPRPAATPAPVAAPPAAEEAKAAEIGPNPDAPGAITLRSFSGQPRTGRPGKMPFRQGTPDDIDAIDE